MTTADMDAVDRQIRLLLEDRAHDLAGMPDEAAVIGALLAPHPGRPFGRRMGRLLMAVAAAGLLVAMLIGVGLVGGPPEEEPRPDFETFRSETSFGTIEWVRTEVAQRIWSEHEIDGQIMGTDEAGNWWRLTEDLAWRPAEAPEPGDAEYSAVGDETWAVIGGDGYGVSMGPVSARQVIAYEWYEDDRPPMVLRHVGDDWVEVPLPRLQPPVAEGLDTFGPRLTGIVSTNASSWILPVQHFLEVPWDQVFDIERNDDGLGASDATEEHDVSSGLMPMWDAESQVLRVGETWPSSFASLTVDIVEGDPSTIEFRDAESRELVHVVEAAIPGWRAEDLLQAVRGWGGLDLSFVVGHSGETSVVRPPWPMSEEWSDEIVVSDGWYYTTSYVVAEDYGADAMHLWRSRDGLTWEAVELPEGFPSRLAWASMGAGAKGLAMWVQSFPGLSEMVWLSESGEDWTEADLSGLPLSWVTGTDFGWFLETGVVSSDGKRWESIAQPLSLDDPPIGYLGGLLFRGPSEVDGRWVTWFGRLVE
jgi:hypothetical protein